MEVYDHDIISVTTEVTDYTAVTLNTLVLLRHAGRRCIGGVLNLVEPVAVRRFRKIEHRYEQKNKKKMTKLCTLFLLMSSWRSFHRTACSSIDRSGSGSSFVLQPSIIIISHNSVSADCVSVRSANILKRQNVQLCQIYRELYSSADGVSTLQPRPSGTRFHHSSAHHPLVVDSLELG